MFPKLSSSGFEGHPVLLSSNPLWNTALLNTHHSYLVEGTWMPGDGFLLLTDALAAWFVRETEKGNTPMLSLEENFLFPADRQAKFAAWVSGLRASGEIKDDDTSIIWVGTDPKLTS